MKTKLSIQYKQNLEELMRLTLINILNAKGTIYTHYKLMGAKGVIYTYYKQQERENNAHRQIHNSFYGLYLEEWKAK